MFSLFVPVCLLKHKNTWLYNTVSPPFAIQACCNFPACSARLSGTAAGTSGFKALWNSCWNSFSTMRQWRKKDLFIDQSRKWFMPPHNSIWCALRQTTPLLFADPPVTAQCHLLSRQRDFLPEKMNVALAQNSNDSMRMSRIHNAPRQNRAHCLNKI